MKRERNILVGFTPKEIMMLKQLLARPIELKTGPAQRMLTRLRQKVDAAIGYNEESGQ